MVIEDDPNVRDATIGMLNSLGYAVVDGADGQAVSNNAVAYDDIELLLTDVVLPGGISGPIIARTEREINPAIKIIMMTGYADSNELNSVTTDMPHRLLKKPFDLKTPSKTVFDTIHN